MENARFSLDSVSGLDIRSVPSKGVEENVRKRKRRVVPKCCKDFGEIAGLPIKVREKYYIPAYI